MHCMKGARRGRVLIDNIAFGPIRRGWFLLRRGETHAAYMRRCVRAGADKHKLLRYVRGMTGGKTFTPVLLLRIGNKISVDDGLHRICAAVLARHCTVDAVIVPAASWSEADEFSSLMFDLEYYGAAPWGAVAAMATANAREVAHV